MSAISTVSTARASNRVSGGIDFGFNGGFCDSLHDGVLCLLQSTEGENEEKCSKLMTRRLPMNE